MHLSAFAYGRSACPSQEGPRQTSPLALGQLYSAPQHGPALIRRRRVSAQPRAFSKLLYLLQSDRLALHSLQRDVYLAGYIRAVDQQLTRVRRLTAALRVQAGVCEADSISVLFKFLATARRSREAKSGRQLHEIRDSGLEPEHCSVYLSTLVMSEVRKESNWAATIRLRAAACSGMALHLLLVACEQRDSR